MVTMDRFMMTARQLCFGVVIVLMTTVGLVMVPAQSNRGEVQIYVFSDTGEPLEGVEVRLDDNTIVSDANGLINFAHPPGSHEFDLYYAGSQIATVEMSVRQGSVTEAIVSAAGSGQVQGDSQQAERDDDGAEPQFDPDAEPGTLSGTVTEIEEEEPVAGATIVLRGIDLEATTDEEGRFEIEVPEGLHTFSVIQPDFSTQTISEVEVEADRETVIDVELTPQAVALAEQAVFAVEEVRVEGGIAKLIEEMADSDAVVSFIGQEQIGRSGDSDAAGALRRITGLTIVDDRFVYVRGMGERYSSSYLNGVALPSPEVDKRVVPLDLFPTGIIETLSVQKTYSPELPGQFGGGAVNIETIGLPDDQYRRRLRTDISFSLTYNEGVSFEDRLFEEGGDFDFLGFDDGTRAMPDRVADADRLIDEGSSLDPDSGYTAEEREKFGESFPRTWSPEKRTIPLDYSGSISMRDKFELSEFRNFGFTASLSIKDSWDSRDERQSYFEPSEEEGELGRAIHDYDVEVNSRDIDIGALVELVYEDVRSFRLESSSLLVRATDSTVETLQGEYGSEQFDIRETETSWVEQTLLNQALRGQHRLPALGGSQLMWNYGFSFARSNEPDRRYYVFREDQDDGNFEEEGSYLWQDQTANRRNFTDVNDYVNDGGVSISIPVGWFGNPSADFVDFGVGAFYQTREQETRRFGYRYSDAGANRDIVEQDPDDMFTDENIGPDGIFDFREYTLPTDNVSSEQVVLSGYTKGDILVLGNARLSTGVRAEWSRQTVSSFDPFTGEAAPEQELEPESIVDMLMPAINLTVPTGDDSQVRVGASATVNRPDLNELSPSERYSGAPGGGSFQGNPTLKIARIYNADARWEWYLAEREFISIGGFFKQFQDPIERFALNRGGGELLTTLGNVSSAQNFGAELEWQLTGRYVGDLLRGAVVNVRANTSEQTLRRRRFLGGVAGVFRDMTMTGNFALIQSEIDGRDFQLTLADPNTGLVEEKSVANTNETRPLEGQSPYVLNLSLGYRNTVSWSQERDQHTSIFFNYNVFGPRIVQIGTNGVPDIYEQPFNRLNLVINQSLSQYVSVGFTANNLLNPLSETTLSDERKSDGSNVAESRRLGRSYSLSVKLSL